MLGACRLAPKKLPPDIVATNHRSASLPRRGRRRRTTTTRPRRSWERPSELRAECFMGAQVASIGRRHRLVERGSSRHPGWRKFILRFRNETTSRPYARHIYHPHAMVAAERGRRDADDMLREVQQRFNTLDGLAPRKPRSCSAPGALELAITLHGKPLRRGLQPDLQTVAAAGPQADVGDYIHSRIGWRVLVPPRRRALLPHGADLRASRTRISPMRTSHGASLDPAVA